MADQWQTGGGHYVQNLVYTINWKLLANGLAASLLYILICDWSRETSTCMADGEKKPQNEMDHNSNFPLMCAENQING